MRPDSARLVLLLLSLFVATGQVLAESQDAPRLERVDQARVRPYREAAISPNGKRVSWVEELAGEGGEPSSQSAIYIADLADGGGSPRRITAGDGKSGCAEHSVAWSADGERLAFLSDRDKAGQLQAYVAAAEGGEARRLTSVTGFLANLRWSPDGKRLGVLFTQDAPKAAGPLQPGIAQTGLVEERVYEQRLSSIDVASREFRQVSPDNLYVYEYDWSSDGGRCVVIAAHGSGDNNWYIAKIGILSMDTGRVAEILDPKMQIAVPRWSPDGRSIAFIGGLMSDEGMTGGDIYIVSVSGGEARNLTPDLRASASWLAWHPSSRQILFAEHVDGQSGLARVDLGGNVTSLWEGAERITAEGPGFALGVSVSRDQDTLALIRSSHREPPGVLVGPIGRWRPVADANREIRPNWGEVKDLHWKSDAFEVQGWLLYPRGYDHAVRYPMVVLVHGGPSGAFTPGWLGSDSLAATLSRRGYFVLMPNPRGSFGRGERFTRSNVKDFGYGDLRDIVAGVDEVLRTLPVDADRIGITGWSYGGYMTMWAVTQTGRFRAAVAGAGICNWQSYYGQNGIDQWMIPFFGASAYDDPDVYARSSPITFIKRVKTPTLILVGERDLECPVPQSQEFYHALRTLGVTSQMMVYPGEGHMIARPEHRRDVVERSVGWFNRFVRPDRK
jgi:dipeptidyl aminopeptidase/acylaminoacyl peptidase